jgi:hypothetical protein
MTVNPEPVMMAPAEMTRNPYVANRPHVVDRTMNVVWPIANGYRYGNRTIRG